MAYIDNYINDLCKRYPKLTQCAPSIEHAYNILRHTYMYRADSKVLVCGNGGSASDADHIVGELMKSFKKKRRKVYDCMKNDADERIRDMKYHMDSYIKEGSAKVLGKLEPALPAINLCSHTALMTAIANDTGAEMVFAQQVYGIGRINDTLIGLSTSGNSENVVNAFIVARAMNIDTIALTGRDGGKLSELADECIIVPEEETFKIQELHLPIYHALCAALEDELFEDGQSKSN